MTVLDELEHSVGALGSCVVAFSGGVDSSLVAAVAVRVLGERALAVTAVSPALASGELAGARAVARTLGIPHETVTTDELSRLGYVSNGTDRCFHCKSALYERLSALAQARGFHVLASGANADDLGDWRPGLTAASEHGVRHPLLENGMSKDAVRKLARELAVPSADKPAAPCLASRLPYGTPVTPDVLRKVDRAERALKDLGYRELRVRHFGRLGRVELGAAELATLARPDRAAIEHAVRSAGYDESRIHTAPLRSGSLNTHLRDAGTGPFAP